MSGIPEEFIRQLTAHHNRLLAFITALVGDYASACDVLQETHIELWKKADSFKPGSNFFAWACAIARFKVLEARAKQRKDRLIFDEALVETLATEAERHPAMATDTGEALESCLGELSTKQRELVRQRYESEGTLKTLADVTGRSAQSLGVSLFRIRKALLECIQRKQMAQS